MKKIYAIPHVVVTRVKAQKTYMVTISSNSNNGLADTMFGGSTDDTANSGMTYDPDVKDRNGWEDGLW